MARLASSSPCGCRSPSTTIGGTTDVVGCTCGSTLGSRDLLTLDLDADKDVEGPGTGDKNKSVNIFRKLSK